MGETTGKTNIFLDCDVEIKFFLPRLEQNIWFVLPGMFPRVYVACLLDSVVDSLGRAEPSADTRAHPSCAAPTFSLDRYTYDACYDKRIICLVILFSDDGTPQFRSSQYR